MEDHLSPQICARITNFEEKRNKSDANTKFHNGGDHFPSCEFSIPFVCNGLNYVRELQRFSRDENFPTKVYWDFLLIAAAHLLFLEKLIFDAHGGISCDFSTVGPVGYRTLQLSYMVWSGAALAEKEAQRFGTNPPGRGGTRLAAVIAARTRAGRPFRRCTAPQPPRSH